MHRKVLVKSDSSSFEGSKCCRDAATTHVCYVGSLLHKSCQKSDAVFKACANCICSSRSTQYTELTCAGSGLGGRMSCNLSRGRGGSGCGWASPSSTPW